MGLHFVWRKPLAKIFSFWWNVHSKRLANSLLPLIHGGATVLDIGAGSGVIAKELSLRADVTLLDVIDWNITGLPLILFDGVHFPFDNKKFDVGLLVDVLHHVEQEDTLIQEAMRVCHKVLVVEEVHEHKLMNILENVKDNFQYLLYGMSIGVHHRTQDQWASFLKNFCSSVQCKKGDSS